MKKYVPIDINLISDLPNDRPYTQLEAVFDLSVDINRDEKKSERHYAHKWQWSRTKTRKFLNDLRKQKDHKKTTKKTTKRPPAELFIKELQKQKDHKKTTKKTTKEPPELRFGRYVKLTQQEYDELLDQYGRVFTARCIEKLDDYIPNKKGEPYKDHAAAIRMWVVRTVREEQSKKQNSQSKAEVLLGIQRTEKKRLPF